MQIKSDIDERIIFLINKPNLGDFGKCVPSLYVSTDIAISFFLSKKISSFNCIAEGLFLANLPK